MQSLVGNRPIRIGSIKDSRENSSREDIYIYIYTPSLSLPPLPHFPLLWSETLIDTNRLAHPRANDLPFFLKIFLFRFFFQRKTYACACMCVRHGF